MNNYDGWKDGSVFFVDSRRWKRPFHLIADNHLKYIKTDASQKRLKALIFRKFSTRKLLAENTRILRWFGKWLVFSRLASKNHKIPFAGWKKSTPKKNLALPFSDRACLRKRKSAQKSSKILHKTALAVQNSPKTSFFFRPKTLHKPSEVCISRSRMKINFVKNHKISFHIPSQFLSCLKRKLTIRTTRSTERGYASRLSKTK